MLTQKYKQAQQQVRVLTNESNYLKGMYFSDVPLAEGYSRMLVNFDIDSLSGKLSPRKGLQSLGLVYPSSDAKQYLNNSEGFNTIVQSKVCSASDKDDPRKINRQLQNVLYNTSTRALSILTCPAEVSTEDKFDVIPFTLNSNDEFVTPEPFIIGTPGIHSSQCIHNKFFQKPVGTFAFGNSYYTFLRRNKYSVCKIAELPNENYLTKDGNIIYNYTDFVNSEYNIPGKYSPGMYFKFTSGDSTGVLVYSDLNEYMTIWERSEEALQLEVFKPLLNDAKYALCYTKLGADIQPDEVFLDTTIEYDDRKLDVYYTMLVEPQRLNPSEASSWGYNMLMENPYEFTCEEVAVNTVTILGILPYNKEGIVPVLTPRKNQEITLKGYYRAPTAYHTNLEHKKYYATTKIEEVEDVSKLPTADALNEGTRYKYGDWWFVKNNQEYYMCAPTSADTKQLINFGKTQPAASELLNAADSSDADPIRVRWQIRHSGASDWIDIHNETLTLEEHAIRYGKNTPFRITTQLPADEVLVKLTITDTKDISNGEEYVLSTMTIGLSLVSDELANTLNLDSKIYRLGQATGMCEWEQRIVLWGVPGALNTLFISDVNNPTFFPYPNNIDIFTDPIISVHNYGNELLVLTTSALYRLTWNTEGTGWTHILVQQNLHVTEADTYMSCVIKNMFFFKSGEYYYMMVPKASSSIRGEVTIAPISKSIENLLDNFHKEVYNLIKVISDYPEIVNLENALVNYFSYVDNTKVIVNYVYDLNQTIGDTESVENSQYLYAQLIYDTESRTWCMRVFETAHMFYPTHADAIQQDRFIDITPVLNANKLALQYYKFTGLTDASLQYVDSGGFEHLAKKIIKNYQYLDTGNRDINTELKKRFREFQFKIKNNTNTNLGFFTSFLIDGSLRKDLQRYSPRLITDPSTNASTIVVERVLDASTMTYNTTRIERILIPERMLQDNGELTPTILAEENDPDRWVLNQSAFPGRTLWKIRMPISGKGLTPRVIFLSTNEADYELLGHSWAYRTMNSR